MHCAMQRRMGSASWRLTDVAGEKNLLSASACPLISTTDSLTAVHHDEDTPWMGKWCCRGRQDRHSFLYAHALTSCHCDDERRRCASKLGVPGSRRASGWRRRV